MKIILSILMLAALPVLLALAPVPKWYQLESIPWVYVNKDATVIRIYTSTPKDYVELAITLHGTATVEKAVRILKPHIKSK